MVNTTIQSGKYEIIESNMFFMDSPESEVRMHLIVEGKFVGDIKIHFLTDQKIESQNFELKVQDGTLMIWCTNFNSSFGTGTTKLVPIGFLDGKKLFMHLWSYYFTGESESASRKVEYSILREIS